MTVIPAIAIGVIMTLITAAVAGTVLKVILFALGRSLSTSNAATVAQADGPSVAFFKAPGNTNETLEWAEEAAA